MRKTFFGYNMQDVKNSIDAYENLIDIQRRDIDYLKRDNAMLKDTISNLMTKNSHKNKR